MSKPVQKLPKKKKFQMEFTIKSSPGILFDFLSTPSGLAQWFADEVDQTGSEFIFNWEGSEQRAILADGIEDDFVRFQWKDGNPDEYFEFKIEKTEISNDTVLIITDFAEERDINDQRRLWDTQIRLLVQRIGGS